MIKKDNSTTSYKVSKLEKLRLLSLNEELILEKIEQAENNFNPAKLDLRRSLKTYFNNFEKLDSFDDFIRGIDNYYWLQPKSHKDFESKKGLEILNQVLGIAPVDYSVGNYGSTFYYSSNPQFFLNNKKPGYDEMVSYLKLKLRIPDKDFELIPKSFDLKTFLSTVDTNLFEFLVDLRWNQLILFVDLEVFYDLENESILFHNDEVNKNLVKIGTLKIEKKSAGTKTPLLTAIVSGNKSKMRSRIVKDVKKMLQNSYLKYLQKTATVQSVMKGESPSLFLTDEEIKKFFSKKNNKNFVSDLKKLYRNSSTIDKKRVMDLLSGILED
jgi:hypothetical protein